MEKNQLQATRLGMGNHTLKIVCATGLLLIPLILFEAWVFTRQEPYRIKTLRLQLCIILSVSTFLSSAYIWKRFGVLIHSDTKLTLFLKFLILTIFLLAQLSFVFVALVVRTDPLLLSYIATFSLGSLHLLAFSMAVIDACSFLYRRIVCRRSPMPGSSDKTELRLRMLVSLVSALFLIVVGSMGANSLTVEYVTVPVKGLNSHLNGTTIVQVSDVHLGPFNGRSTLSSLVERVNQVEGDIVAITGDLVDSSVEALREAVQPLRKLKSKYGAYYITGNHEYYTGDVDNWLVEIPKLNVTPLVNERVCIPGPKKNLDCKGGLYLAGLEDLATRNLRYGSHSMNIHSALSGRTGGIPTVVLAHQPWAAQEAIMWDDVRLVLSGHTHAGQVLPLMFLTYIYNPFFVGLYQPYPQVYVYVNPGSVYYFLPFRHYRPEITCITLISQ